MKSLTFAILFAALSNAYSCDLSGITAGTYRGVEGPSLGQMMLASTASAMYDESEKYDKYFKDNIKTLEFIKSGHGMFESTLSQHWECDIDYLECSAEIVLLGKVYVDTIRFVNHNEIMLSTSIDGKPRPAIRMQKVD